MLSNLIRRSFTILSEDRNTALEMRGPAKSVYADMEIHVAAKIRECLDDSSRNSSTSDQKTGKNGRKNKGNKNRNKNKRREEKYKYFWSIEGPNSADLSARNQPGMDSLLCDWSHWTGCHTGHGGKLSNS